MYFTSGSPKKKKKQEIKTKYIIFSEESKMALDSWKLIPDHETDEEDHVKK